MKVRNMFLAGLLVFSGFAMAMTGVVVKFVLLEPLGLSRQETVVELPFVLLRDDGLRYVITDLRRDTEPEETEPPMPSIQPTYSDQTEPTEVDLPQQDPLERVLFIGDSRTCGLRDHARLEGADYFCEVGMSVFNVDNQKLSDQTFQNCTIASLLAEREYTCVVINLGLNEAGYPLDSLLHAYRELLNTVVQTQPQAVTVVQGVLTVSRRWAELTPYASPENLRSVNCALHALADEYRVNYIDANECFADENGYLPNQLTADGCHLYAKYASLWADWICRTVKNLD